MIAITNIKRIPDNCTNCRLSETYRYGGGRYCVPKNKEIELSKVESGNMAYIRPKWCPLKEIK
jgi:hypothetical protein